MMSRVWLPRKQGKREGNKGKELLKELMGVFCYFYARIDNSKRFGRSFCACVHVIGMVIQKILFNFWSFSCGFSATKLSFSCTTKSFF